MNMPLNTNIIVEFLILIAGPIFQIIGYLFLKEILPTKEEILIIYHYGILLFNLLPIYPLDGGKLLNIIISLKLPYKKTQKLVMLISYIIVIIIFIINRNNININLIIVTIFLIYKVTKEYKNIEYTYNKFLLERYLNNYNFKSSIIIDNINNLYRNKRHLIKKDNNYYLEKEILEKKYKNYTKSVDFNKNAML